MKATSVEELSQFVGIVSEYPSGAMYRGVESDSYKLIPSLGRYLETAAYCDDLCKERTLQEHESEAMRQFKLRSVPYLSHLPEDDFEWLALAQHYGLPTRLLDWSFSPLVALFFAIREGSGVNGLVYILSENVTCMKWTHLHAGISSPFQITEVVGLMPKHLDSRMGAQDTVFTVHPPPWQAFEPDSLEKIIVKADHKRGLLKELRRHGIHEQSLFPGLGGVAKWVRISQFLS
jgi:hypothetical protein